MIPTGIPKLLRVVKNGQGGPAKNAIPVKEDLGSNSFGYLINGTQVWIVDPNYPGISAFRKLYNGSTWVKFEPVDTSLFSGLNDIWCEENGHLFAVENTPPVGEGEDYEILAEGWKAGRKFITLKKL